MRKHLLCLCIGIFFYTFLACSSYAEHYINGFDPSFPPFSFIDESGHPAGFDIDSLNWVAKTMGFTIEHRPIDWDGIIPALITKKIDMICSGMSVTEEREQQVLFTKVYWKTKKIFIAKESTSLTPEHIYFGENIRLGVQRGTNEASFLQEGKQKKQYTYMLMFYDSVPLAIKDLLHGRIKAVALDATLAQSAIDNKKNIKIIGSMEKDNGFAIAVRKNDEHLAQILNAGYEKLQADPFWEQLQKQYHLVQ